MSTRCQVCVIEGSGAQPWERLTLYRHCDGYPEAMLPFFVEAFDKFGARGYRSGRAGYVASFLCATDPEGIQPEAGHELHGDIEFYYRLYVSGRDSALWEVEVIEARRNATLADPGRVILPRRDVRQAVALPLLDDEVES